MSKLKRAFGKRFLALVLSGAMIMSNMTVSAAELSSGVTKETSIEETADDEVVVHSEESSDESEDDKESTEESSTVEESTIVEETKVEETKVEESKTEESKTQETTTEKESSKPATQAEEVDYSQGFELWFNTDGSTGIAAGEQSVPYVYAGEAMAGNTNSQEINGTTYYAVTGSNNPKINGNNPNGKIPNSGAYLKVTAPADGKITVYGYYVSNKPFYITKSDTALVTDATSFENGSYTITVKEGEEWYFYSQGGKAQFIGVVFSLPAQKVSVPVELKGVDIGTATIALKETKTGDKVEIKKDTESVELEEGSTYNVSIDSAKLTIDVEKVEASAEKITITVSEAKTHEVSGSLKGLPSGATVTKLVYTDESNVETEATVKNGKYSVNLKNGKYTASATVTGADGYEVYDHVKVEGTEGEDISNDVWFYAPETTYSSTYVSKITVGAKGNYKTINEAVAAATAMTRGDNEYVTIELLDSDYEEQVIINTPNIKLVAADGVKPTVHWYYGIGYKYYSIDGSVTNNNGTVDLGYYSVKCANDKYEMYYADKWGTVVRLNSKATGFIAEGITFKNTFNIEVVDAEIGDSKVGTNAEYGQSISGSLQERKSGLGVANTTNVERAAAMVVDCDKAEFYGCTFISSQDTLYTGSASSYYRDCTIVGQTDYIFGNTGTSAIFDNCELQWLGYTGSSSKPGYITATRGTYLFRGCTITKNADENYSLTSGYFGRPWGNAATVYFVGTSIADDTLLNADGWYNMSGVNPEDATFREYGNTVGEKLYYTEKSKDKESTFRLPFSSETSGIVTASSLADPANDSTFLGDWTPVNHRTEKLALTEDWANGPTEDADEAVSGTETHIFDATTLTAAADKEAVADGTTFDDGYFQAVSKVTKRTSSTTGKVTSVELDKFETGKFSFTVNGTADVTIAVCSTGGSNTSTVALKDSEGNVIENKEKLSVVTGTSKTNLTYEGLTAGTYTLVSPKVVNPDQTKTTDPTNDDFYYNRGVRLYTVTSIETAIVVTEEHTFDATTLTAAADKEAVADGTTFDDGYFQAVSKVTKRTSSTTGKVTSVELDKFETGKFSFTVNGTADVTIAVCSTGGSNTSTVALKDSEGNVIENKEKLSFVTGTSKTTLTYEGLTAGTYTLVSPKVVNPDQTETTDPTNDKYYYNRGVRIVTITSTDVVSGTRAPRADWDTVASPVITNVDLNTSDKSKIDINYNMVIGYDGADNVRVDMLDAEGKVVGSATSTTTTATIAPETSGTYTFIAYALRGELDEKKSAESDAFAFTYLLAEPVLKSATNEGSGSVLVEWNAVQEATGYEVTYYLKDGDKTDSVAKTVTAEEGKELATEITLEGLTVGSEYTIEVRALREGTGLEVDKYLEKSEAGIMDCKVVDEVQRTWAFAAFGASTTLQNDANGYSGNANDGEVTVWSTNGKGKIVPASTDGIAFYYTDLDPVNDNFVLEANVHVDSWTLSNGQEGFGLMVADRVGVNGDGTDPFWNNSYMAVATKIEYRWDKENGKLTTDSEVAASTSMKLGIGSIARTGVPAGWVSSTLPSSFKTSTDTLETVVGKAKGSGTYNIIGNYTDGSKINDVEGAVITDLRLKIERNNTGYIISYYSIGEDEEGQKTYSLEGQNTYYDIKDFTEGHDNSNGTLMQMDTDKIYLGFFASRNAKVTFSDINLTVTNAATDAPAEEQQYTYIDPSYSITSASTANSATYDLEFYSNAHGYVTIKDSNGNTIANNVEIGQDNPDYTEDSYYLVSEKVSKLTFTVSLKEGKNKFTWTMNPINEDVEEYTRLSDYTSKSDTFTVTYNKVGDMYIYVSPDAKSSGKGTLESPMLLTEAIKYVSAGQTIVLMEGTYNLKSSLTINHGIDGTEENPIKMIADPDASSRPVINFGGTAKTGMTIAGNYWVFQGFDVTGSGDGTDGIKVSGSHNLLDSINTYKNGNTGIQISRLKTSDATIEDWPSYNTIKNCTSYLNADAGYEDADGFAAKLTVGPGNVFDGCVAAYNADDGWDLFAKVETGPIGQVTIKNCIAYGNGYVLKELEDGTYGLINAGNGNGFKMGGSAVTGNHILQNCVAFNNKQKGIDSNSGPNIQVYDSISFNNESYNVAFYTGSGVSNTDYIASGVISFRTKYLDIKENIVLKGTQNQGAVNNNTNFFWNESTGKSVNTDGIEVSADWFENLEAPATGTIIGVENPVMGIGVARNSDGTLNLGSFLKLTDKAAEAVKNAGLGTGTASDIIDNDVITADKESAANEGLVVSSVATQTYTGKAIKPSISVTSGVSVLKKSDYTVSYRNNVNAGTATIYVTGKGNFYTETHQEITFEIAKKSLEDSDITLKTGSLTSVREGQKPMVTVLWGTKILSASNYTLTYYKASEYGKEGAQALTSCTGAEDGKYIIEIKGNEVNFTGTITANYTVLDKNHIISNAKVSYTYKKNANTQFVGSNTIMATGAAVTLTEDDIVVTLGGKTLTYGVDYELVNYNNNYSAGTATYVIRGLDNGEEIFAGEKTGSFMIKAVNFATVYKNVEALDSKGVYKSLPELTYNGSDMVQSSVRVIAKNTNDDGTDRYIDSNYYTISYNNNTKAGTATMIITGKGIYTGKVTKTFKINAYDIATLYTDENKAGIKVEGTSADYQKGGVTLDSETLILTYYADSTETSAEVEKELTRGTDYTVSYRYNNKVTVVGDNRKPQVVIRGKGLFTGVLYVDLDITPQDLNGVYTLGKTSTHVITVTVADKFALSATKNWASAVTVKDMNNKTLTGGNGKNADYTVTYSFTDESGLHDNITAKDASKYTVNPGTEITVNVTAGPSGLYFGSISKTYRVLGSAQNISSAIVTQASDKLNPISYTGEAITLDTVVNTDEIDNLPLTIKNSNGVKLVLGEDYEVVAGTYKNNIKKGTASVTIHGIKNYGGTKTVTYRISAKKLEIKKTSTEVAGN